VRVATRNAPAPLLPRGCPSASRAAEQTQRSSSFPSPNTFSQSPVHLSHALSKATRWPWPLTLKVVSESRVTWATSMPILVLLGLSVVDLGPMYVTERRQTDRHHTRQTSDSIIT